MNTTQLKFNVDHSNGNNMPTPLQIKQGMAILRKAKELRRIING